ncbi:unnamed protein product [Acanthocheilonema viteae]|uniref:Uncharacterized protein n=1 Tax=Acanthocheilonema viteae TaxID=6277 RepID=A0A498SJA5_ACAVI|nr:unnamed protein product [Acanthocheilonema viteae]
MSGKDKPKSRSKSRSKEYSDKSQKKDEGSKMQISLKETKEKKSVTKKEQKDNKNIDKKEFQRLAKKNEVKMDENAMMMMMMMTDIEKNLPISNSIDKMKQSLSSGSKLLTVNSTSTTKKYPEKIIVNKLEKLKSRKKSCEKLGKHEAKYIPKISDDKVQKLKSDKSSSNCITDNSIDKAGRSSLSVKCSKSTYQNLHTSKLPPPTCAKILPAVPLSHIDEYDYEDDFEDYSDDFEEESENESSDRESTEGRGKKSEQNSAVSRNLTISRIGGTSNRDSLIDATINESYENSPLLHRIMNRSRSDDNVQPLQMQSIHFHGCTQRKIDFANATTTINWEKMSEVERRYKMLKNLIGMEIVQFDLLDHQVIRAYDFYVQMFGNANYIQVQTQTGDDKLNCYVQTEEMDKETVWTQIPYSDPQGWGIANISDGIDYCERFGSEIEHSKISHFEMTKFCKFISIAGQVFIDIMQSSSNCATQPSLEYRASLKFSTGYNKFSLGNLVNSSKVTSMLHRENQLFIAFYVEQTSNDDIINRSIIVEFDICSPHNPKKILLCHNEVRCFCMSPDDARAVFVGLAS